MKKRYVVTLTDEERRSLRTLASTGKGAARKLTHARVLLKADASPGGPNWTDAAISEGVDVGTATVERVRQLLRGSGHGFVEEGLEAALVPSKPDRIYERKLDGDGEAHLIALACSESPEGRSRWTLELLADRMVALGHVESLSYQTVRRVLKKTRSSLG